MQIPAAAFITNFTMLIGDKVFQGEITEREKENGSKVKERRNKTAEDDGEKGTDTFRASAVIPSKDKAVFLLTYEELLQRRLGKYEHVVSVRPQQLVGRLTVEVNILERSGLSSLEVLPLHDTRHRPSGRAEGEHICWKHVIAQATAILQERTLLLASSVVTPQVPAPEKCEYQETRFCSVVPDDAGPPPSTVINQNETFAKVLFKPSVVQQAKIAQNGVLGDFIVRYDVNRAQSIGDIQVLDGYFVHYFAPRDLPPLPKNVVFVLDSSASMVGTKLRQIVCKRYGFGEHLVLHHYDTRSQLLALYPIHRRIDNRKRIRGARSRFSVEAVAMYLNEVMFKEFRGSLNAGIVWLSQKEDMNNAEL
ncbi:Inter-alpha-trypsin inhibitor heavy chain H5 [Pteropus alecto]|uniref:Inter-alpha-trypsin inhibitor heavy chain H5 n=1 Tax=Pteropus alecto TaxID=9402 RepID=L5L0Y2_PTEAL|nr:Inter-alpha-trypsin inhibitor heavy chain H5 [Pteropus alecto]